MANSLQKEWRASLRLWNKGDKLFCEGKMTYEESSQLWRRADSLWQDTLFANGLTAEWFADNSCKLSNGEIYHA